MIDKKEERRKKASMKIKITSDSTCDLSPELITENNISIFPLTVIKGDKEFKDGVDIAPIDIMMQIGRAHV